MNWKDWFKSKPNYNPKCKFLIFTKHDYGRWELVSKGKVIRGGLEIIGHFIVQQRICKNCHYTDVKHEEKLSNAVRGAFRSLFPETSEKPKGQP